MAKRTTKTVIENGVVWTVGRDITSTEYGDLIRWNKGNSIYQAYDSPSQTKVNIWNEWDTYFKELAKQRNKETAGCMHQLTHEMYVTSRNAHFFTIGCRIGNTFYYVTSTRQERHLITDMI